MPLLATVKITIPVGTFVRESLNLNSVAVTVTFVVVTAGALELAEPPGARTAPAAMPTAASATSTNT